MIPVIARRQTRSRPALRNPHRRRGRLEASCVVLVAAFALVPSAGAHVTLSPAFVEAGVPTLVAFQAPNERTGRVTTSLELEAPAGVELAASDPPAGWRLDVSDGRARWSGGRIEDEATVAFPLLVTAGQRVGMETFRAMQGYDDGATVRWQASLTIVPRAAEDAPPQRLGRALAAAGVGLAAIALSLLVLRGLRRRPLQEK